MEEAQFSLKTKPGWRESLTALPFVIKAIREVDPKLFYLNIILSILIGPLGFLSVYCLKYLTDAVTASDVTKSVYLGVALVAVAFISDSINAWREALTDLQRYRAEVALDNKAVQHLASLPYRVIEDSGFQGLVTAYRTRAYTIMNIQTQGMRLFQGLISVLGLTGTFIFLPWQATLFVCLALISTFALFTLFPSWSWNVMSRETREGRRALYYWNVFVAPVQLLTAKALELTGPFIKRWRRLSDKVLEAKTDQAKRARWVYVLGSWLQNAGLAAGLIVLIPPILAHTVAVSVFVVFISIYQNLTRQVENMSWQLSYLMEQSSFLPIFKRFFTIVVEKNEGTAVPREPLHIRFENVWFRYPGTHKDVLRSLNLEFTQGDQIALVGLNGAGKSTILKLLMGVYEPTRGKIMVNGIDLRDIKPSAWRKALAVLTQDDQTFQDVVREQVHYGDYARPLEGKRFARALSTSGLRELAKELPRGLDTHAGKYFAMPEDEAIELSGGQKQIVAIARTLYREAKFYIFDEPTSAVDAEKEERFFQLLPQTLQGSGVIFVSHRFSTLRRGAERVIVIDQGKVIEDGTHEELMSKQGRYAELFALQAKSYQ